MKKILITLVSMLIWHMSGIAAEAPLRVGITHYSPPFVMQGSNQQVYGFDIALMQQLCHTLQRTCQFKTMRFEQLIPAVKNNLIDAAVAAITITPERSEIITFSKPYLVSQSQFLTNSELAAQPFGLQLLANKSIGFEEGSVFAKQLRDMGIKNPKIVPFETEEELVDALNQGTIDFALVDSASARYWQSDTDGILKAVGTPFDYGYGFGIALNQKNSALITSINQALDTYIKSDAYQKNYAMYLAVF